MTGDPKRALRMMAVPMLVSLVVAQLNTLVDTFWCSSLGSVSLAAVGVVESIYLILSGIGAGIGVGVSASLAAKVARRDKKTGDAIATQSVVFMTVVGLLCTPVLMVIGNPIIMLVGGQEIYDDAAAYALPYYLGAAIIVLQEVFAGVLRGEGASKKSMVIMVIEAILNIIFDPIFTFVFGWGIQGLAWATVVAIAVSVIPFIYWYFIRPQLTYLDIHLRHFRFNRQYISDFLSIGIPKAVELDIMAFVNFALNFFVVCCGGAFGLAVYSTAWKFVDLILVPSAAIGGALIPICAAAYGRCDFGKVRLTYRYAMGWTLAITAVLAVLVYFAADWLMVLFTYSNASADLREPLVHATRIFMIIGILYSAINVSSSLMQAMRKSNGSMWSTLIRNLTLIIVFGITCRYTLDTMWWGFVAAEVFGMTLMVGWAEYAYRLRRRVYGPQTS